MTSQYHLRRNLILVNKISHLSHIATEKILRAYRKINYEAIRRRSLRFCALRVRDSNVANNRWRNVDGTSGPHARPPPCVATSVARTRPRNSS